MNKIHLFGFATPLFYVYFILKLPSNMGRNSLIITACFLGFAIDFFSYTLGFNMLACTLMGFFRYYVLSSLAPRDMADSFIPSVKSFGLSLFMGYAMVLVAIHHIVLFVVESFTFFDIITLVLGIIGSSLLTLSLILGTEEIKLYFFKKK
ncbi:MAG: rod shape-determining protein MreD [Candidatus Azobacteroides sp.]|nr:rod shape-determining protein MreD [Candidatus Azobacteroides sp.]